MGTISPSNYRLGIARKQTRREASTEAWVIGFGISAGETDEKRRRGRMRMNTSNATRRPPREIFSMV